MLHRVIHLLVCTPLWRSSTKYLVYFIYGTSALDILIRLMLLSNKFPFRKHSKTWKKFANQRLFSDIYTSEK